VALLCAGQSSTLTGTMAGQIVMEGFLNFRMRPWLRRLVTRTLAVVPAAATIYVSGEKGTYQLLILSQVILSMQLPFAVIPLIHFTNDRRRMAGFANPGWVRWLAWAAAAAIVALNVRLVVMGVSEWLAAAGPWRAAAWLVVAVAGAALAVLLLWITLEPVVARMRRFEGRPVAPVPDTGIQPVAPAYARIMVTLDHTGLDREAVAHAAAMGRSHGSKLYLVHVEEGVTSQVYGPLASTAEVEAGAAYLERIAASLRAAGMEVETAIFHSSDPRKEIVRYARQVRPDLLIMGAHGHGGLKDLVFGTTINPVRHDLDVPVLVVRGPDSKA
jgi:manganese transport protein